MEKVFIIVVLGVILIYGGITLFNRSSPSKDGATYQRISASEAKELMGEREVIVLDVRTDAEFKSGHIQGAINLPVEKIGSTQPTQLPDPDAMILVYCRSGVRSAQAARKLLQLGYTNVFDFGGITGWPGDLIY